MLKKTLFINGIEGRAVVEAECTLMDFLRKQKFLLGVKEDHGECTVIYNGKATGACTIKMKDVPDDARLTTIEGLGSAGDLHPLQMSWIMHKAGQCGVCTPGFILSAKALLDEKANPSKAEVVAWFKANGNTCKGANLETAAEAVLDAAKLINGKATKEELWLRKTGEAYTPGAELADTAQVEMATGTFEGEGDLKLKLPVGTLYGSLVCPAESGSNVFSIDVSEAEKQPGVFKIITSKDVTGTNRVGATERILFDKTVTGPCDAIAAVLAFTQAAATEAAGKVKATVEPSGGKSVPPAKGNSGKPAVAFAYMNEKGRLVLHSARNDLNVSAIEDGVGITRGQLAVIPIPGSGASGAHASGSSIEGVAIAAALAAGKPVYLEA